MVATSAAAPSAASAGPKSHRTIKKVAVLGAGIMGSRIALHFANIGVPSLLLDIVPRELTPDEQAKGLTLEHPAVRNRVVTSLFQTALKGKPDPIYTKNRAELVTLGNFDDDMAKVADCDWIIEVVVERLDIKKSVYEKLEKLRKPGSLITSNTSSIPMRELCEGRSDDFRRHFCGTHFFNPPRYLPLLEIIPGPATDPAVIDFLMHYGDLYLGKRTILCKDTPGFIGNRIGIFGFMDLFYAVEKHGLTVEEVDKLTGKLIGHASSATFRTADLVGLDTAVKVAEVLYNGAPNDERRNVFQLPGFVQKMIEQKKYGDKTGEGFYKVVKGAGGKEILSLDIKTLEYKPQIKVKSQALEAAKLPEDTPGKIRALVGATDTHSAFLKDMYYGLFAYCANRIPEIADHLFQIDQAMEAGYGWTYGPFETWDILGVRKTAEAMKAGGFTYAAWVDQMLAAGHETFYRTHAGRKQYYSQLSGQYENIPGGEAFILLDALRTTNVVWQNSGTTLFDIGHDVLCLEFNTKMNTIGTEVGEGLQHGIELATKNYKGLVIGNQGENFSVGANLVLVYMLALEQDFDELNLLVQGFQNMVMRVRYSPVPVVVAPHTMSLGGACEMTMHSDAAVAAAETYIGLVEMGVGLLPGGAGTKELALRVSDEYQNGDVEVNVFQKYLMLAAQAKVATSAAEAFELGILQPHKDRVVVNKARQLYEARNEVVRLYDAGYVMPVERQNVRVMGRAGLAMVQAATTQMVFGHFATEHDKLIADKIGYVMCGGDLSEASEVSERYLLDLEREQFLSLLGTQKTLERINGMLQTGKPVRN